MKWRARDTTGRRTFLTFADTHAAAVERFKNAKVAIPNRDEKRSACVIDLSAVRPDPESTSNGSP